jgi:hypothetical protein
MLKQKEEQTNKTKQKKIDRREARIGGLKKVETRTNYRKKQNNVTCLPLGYAVYAVG